MTDKIFSEKYLALKPHPDMFLRSRTAIKMAKKMCMDGRGFPFTSEDCVGMIIILKEDKLKRVKYGREIDL